MPRLRILLDECIDRRLANLISEHTVRTVPQMKWAGLTNGALLSKAHMEFDIFLTNDQNLSFQQYLVKYDIAVLVLCPASSRLPDLEKVLKKAVKGIEHLEPGTATFIK